MANGTSGTNRSSMTSERLQRVEGLLQDLKADARKAEEEGDTYMLGVYKELLKVASPIVVRAHARIEREEQASFNKAHKHLRQQERQQQQRATPSS